MARVQIFQSGIAREAPEVTPFRAPDFGPGIGPTLERAGQTLGEAAQKVDEIQDISARTEANKLIVAHNELSQTIGQRVKSTLGDGAEAAADKGVEDLQKGTDELLAKASPRARAILQTELANRNVTTKGEWHSYAFEQNKQAFDTSSQAANDKDLEAAGHTDSDAAAKQYLDSIAARNAQRARFFGLPPEWETQENLKYVSEYHKNRAVTIGANSAYGAVQYALDHRDSMSDEDFNSVVRSYHGEATRERAMSMYYGSPLGSDEPLSSTPTDTSTTASTDTPARTADPKAVFNGLIVPNEGTVLKIDNNGHPVKLGINQGANPDVDVSKLTRDGAEKLFTDRYWNAVGADKLPPALAVAVADTAYVAGVKKAKQLLNESGKDVDKFMDLRASFLASLHASNPQKYPDYTDRNKRVAQYASAVGGDGTPLSFQGKVGPKTQMQPVIDEIMARKDIPLDLKEQLIDIAREDRNTQREDQKIKEDDARDTLITVTTKLGDNFTSIKQLPQDALANASPETISSLTDLAKTNRYKKDDSALRPEITATMVSDPQRFMSKDYIPYLMRKGAAPSLISEVQTQQAEMERSIAKRKPDPISSGELWSMAKPAFEASGLGDLDTVTAKKGSAAAKSQAVANAREKEAALGFLHGQATEWANAHPGQKPTEELMRQWIATALLRTKSGTPMFEANDADVYNSLPDATRNSIIRDLRRGGNTSQGKEFVSDVVSYYRKVRSLYGSAGQVNVATGQAK